MPRYQERTISNVQIDLGDENQLNCKIGGVEMALSVYESNTNQRFVTSLIKQDGDVSAIISVKRTVLGSMSSRTKPKGSLNCSRSIGWPSVLIKWMSRLELGLCW